MLARNAEFDWYQSTVQVHCPRESGLVDALLEAWPHSDWVIAKNLNGYTHGGAIKRGDRVLCHLCWGGQPGVNCKTTSDESPVLAMALRRFGVAHLPTRIDSRVDWDEEGLYDSMSSHLVQYALDNRLAIKLEGDWVRGEARTLYVGSTTSPVRLVLYEKGYEQGGGASLNWVRLEVRLRPKREHRASVATWSPETVFTAGWVADATRAFGWDDLERRSVGTIRKPSDEMKIRMALATQYGNAICDWADELGDWRLLGEALAGLLVDLAQDKRSRDQRAKAIDGASAASVATGAAPTMPKPLGNTTNFTDKFGIKNRLETASQRDYELN